MNRRGFLGVFFRSAVYLPLLPIAVVTTSQRRVIVQQSPVAGFQYHEGDKVFHHLRVDTPLALAREADNKYDHDAVAVYFKDHRLGFVPRADNTAVAQMLDRGECISARIVQLKQSQNPWDRVRFEVVLDG